MMTIIVSVSLLCALVVALTGDDTTTMAQPVSDRCPTTRVVNLGLYGFYDDSLVESRKKYNATENITEYLTVLVKAAEEQHFGNISCTNISLVLTGARAIENSSDVEEVDELDLLDVEQTLVKFQEYWFRNRDKLGNPDVGVLFTQRELENKSSGCVEVMERREEDGLEEGYNENPVLKAYCDLLSGVAYYKGACGNNSVAVVQDDGGTFKGTVGLAKGIAQLLGVGFDVFRTEKECRGGFRYYLTSIASQYVQSPDLSQCAKDELTNFVDCVSNQSFVCWNDTVEAAFISKYETPYDFLKDHDFCSRYDVNDYQCPSDQNVSDYNGCYKQCCVRGTNARDVPLFTPYGRRCGGSGMCFADGCFEKTAFHG